MFLNRLFVRIRTPHNGGLESVIFTGWCSPAGNSGSNRLTLTLTILSLCLVKTSSTSFLHGIDHSNGPHLRSRTVATSKFSISGSGSVCTPKRRILEPHGLS